jgi:hypothetical protein
LMTGICLRWRQPGMAAGLLVLACSAYSVQQLRWMHGLSNTEALNEIRYVYMSTGPGDRVLDGFTGFAWFRPHASFYPFFHYGIRARLTARDVEQVIALLDSCEKQPALVILDTNLRGLSPGVEAAVSRSYRRSRFPLIWARDDDRHGCIAHPRSAVATEVGRETVH